MEPIEKSATKRHPLTGAGIVVTFIGAILFVLAVINGSFGSPGAFLIIFVGVILMVAGWMIRMRQAAERR